VRPSAKVNIDTYTSSYEESIGIQK